MPRVKLDYVVSFSSEDKDNPASNLLAWELSKKKWLCSQWEPTCSVVLQLEKAVPIESVHIGTYQASLVEVLVGLSEKPNEPYEVLVPRCVVASAAEARRGEAARVRTFPRDSLAAAARAPRRWDRLRVLAAQPYNKHCQYGLSFIHVFSPEEAGAAGCAASRPAPAAPFAIEAPSSDEEVFRPGELFAKHKAAAAEPPAPAPAATPVAAETQIRRASSNALKNISDSATKLTKTPISKLSEANKKNLSKQIDKEQDTNRQKDSLMYTDDDSRPHDKIDRVVQKRKDEKSREERERQDTQGNRKRDNESKKESNERKSKAMDTNDSASSHKRKRESLDDGKDDDLNNSKRIDSSKTNKFMSNDEDLACKRKKVDDQNGAGKGPGAEASAGAVLRGVVVALSGYVHPRRGALRDAALRLGARVRRDLAPDCTHLICAFPNTPKLRALRAAQSACWAVSGDWLDECERARRRLPEEWFACEPARRRPRPAPAPAPVESDQDTEDEIEQVLMEQAASEAEKQSKPSEPAAADDSGSDVSFVCDHRLKDTITLHSDTDTEPDTDVERDTDIRDDLTLDETKLLPSFLEGCTVVVAGALPAAARPALLRRYLRAYGALVLEEEDVESDTEVQYVVCASAQQARGRGARVAPRWVWRAHALRRLPRPPPDADCWLAE